MWLEQIVRKIGQIAAFALLQGNVRIQWMVLYVFDEVRKAIALRIQVGGVYLVDVACKNNLGVLASPGNDGFYFVWREVLCLIHDEENLGQRAAADKCQRCDSDFFVGNKLVDLVAHLGVISKLLFDKPDIIPNRGQKRIGFRLGIAREEADFPVAQRDNGTGDVNLSVMLALLQCAGEGE